MLIGLALSIIVPKREGKEEPEKFTIKLFSMSMSEKKGTSIFSNRYGDWDGTSLVNGMNKLFSRVQDKENETFYSSFLKD